MLREDIEKKAREIIKFRYERLVLQEKINALVQELMVELNSREKNRLKIGKYSFEIVNRIRRNIDFDLLDNMVMKGIIPEKAFKKIPYKRLIISSSAQDVSGKKMVLKGNKFVME